VNQPQGNAAAVVRITSIEKNSTAIGNGTKDLRFVAQCLNQLRYSSCAGYFHNNSPCKSSEIIPFKSSQNKISAEVQK
jgi:hypothetical protein